MGVTDGIQLGVGALVPLEESFLAIYVRDVVTQLSQTLLDSEEREREKYQKSFSLPLSQYIADLVISLQYWAIWEKSEYSASSSTLL